MPLEVLDSVIKNAAETNIEKILWHGGEPLLAGFGFFKLALELQNKYYSSFNLPENLIQTNGVLLDSKFIRFFIKNKFNIGISFDGINAVANSHRYGQLAEEFTRKVLNAIEEIEANDVPFGLLTVLHKQNMPYLADLYERFSNTKCVLKFTPVLPMGKANLNFNSITPSLNYTLNSLYPLLKKYINNEKVRLKIETFEDAFRLAKGQQAKMCSLTSHCTGKFLCVTTNGDIYPCSRTVNQKERFMGNILDVDLSSARKQLLKTTNSEYILKSSEKNNHSKFCGVSEAENQFNTGLSNFIRDAIGIQDHGIKNDISLWSSVLTAKKKNTDKQDYVFSQGGCHADYCAYSDAVSYYDDRESLLNSVDEKDFALHAILLYTEADVNLCKWAREHGELLHKLSGRFCRVIVPERAALPSSRSKLLLKEMGDDDNRSIKYARLLGVKETEIPCFAFFNKGMPENIMTFHFDPEWEDTQITYAMKNIFQNIYSSYVDASFGEDPFSALMTKLKRDRIGIILKHKTDKSSILSLLKLLVPFI